MHNGTRWAALAATGLVLSLGACDDTTGVPGPGEVAVNFRLADGSTALAASPAGSPARMGGVTFAGSEIAWTGSNGTLEIDEIRIIVREAELESDDGACPVSTAYDDDDDADDHSCEFEAPPTFVDLPLDGTPVEVFTSLVPAGRYDELEVEVDDLDDDWSDHPGHRELREEILSEFPDWPKDASAMVVGTFTPTGGDPMPFRVFLEAEVEVEMELSPPLVVDDQGNAGRALTVDLRPDLWFSDFQGGLLPLHEWDWDATGRLLELEVEFEDGFFEVELED